jgi:hypothetical protein
MKKKRVLLAAGAITVLALTASGAAYAATASPASPQFYGCLHGGVITHVRKTAETCAKSSLAISWSQQGPRGLTGTTGKTGAQGIRGIAGVPGAAGAAGRPGPSTAGPGGLDVKMERITTSGTSASLICGEEAPYALGGGGYDYYTGSGGGGVEALVSDAPSVNGGSYYPDGWSIETEAPPPGDSEIITLWVTCAQ